MNRIKKAVAAALLVLLVTNCFSWSALAQTGYPGEIKRVSFSVRAQAYLVTASNCYPYSRGCLGIISPDHTVTAITDLSVANDVSIAQGYSRYFPFTPCLLRLPHPEIQRTAQSTGIAYTEEKESVFYGGEYHIVDAVPAQAPSKECSIAKVNWREFVFSDSPVRVTYPHPLAFHVRYGNFIPGVPGTLTAVYGYSQYFAGQRFHEGLDTSWRNDPTANVIKTPIPCSPVIVTPGVALCMAPARLESAMFGARDESMMIFNEAMRQLEQGGYRGAEDAAFIFGGFHVVSEDPESPPGRVATLYHVFGKLAGSSVRGKTPWELGIIVPADRALVACATVSGYAGNFAPHCHYQAALIPGSVAREIIATLRENPGHYIKSPDVLATSRDPMWYLFWRTIYKYSIDPALLLYPEITQEALASGSNLADAWRNHPWPQGTPPSVVIPTSWWHTEGVADYLVGIQADGPIEQSGGEACSIEDKVVPGCYCVPKNRNTYNSTNPEFSRNQARAAGNGIRDALLQYVCAKLHYCTAPIPQQME